MLSTLLLLQTQTPKLTFDELEKKKYEAFQNIENFHGKYLVISQTATGGNRQEIELWASKEGRRVKLSLNEEALAESGWTKDQKWVIYHHKKAYTQVNSPGKIPLIDPFKPLPVQEGRVNFACADVGPRFATDPKAVVTSVKEVEEDGKKLIRYEMVANNPKNNGKVTIVQQFSKTDFIAHTFSMTVEASGKKVMQVNGLLKDRSDKPVSTSLFSLDTKIVAGYTKVTDGS